MENFTHEGVNYFPQVDDPLLNIAAKLKFGDLHLKIDHETGLIAIIAIHSTQLGPALGGCRFRPYNSFADAAYDAMRLAHGMTYKAAITGLPLGGGKAVVLKPENLLDREKLFESFGKFVDSLHGRYITAVDSGTSIADMDAASKQTRHVTSTTKQSGDPSPFTAKGVCYAIQAGVKFKFDRPSLEGIHVAIQGIGHVGYHLAKELHLRGARITVTDTNPLAIEQCAREFNANIVAPTEIYAVECDVFAPCALGAVLNDESISLLNTKMVIGSANNQLLKQRHGQMLFDRDILYGPDYVVNAGGLIYAYAQYYDKAKDEAIEKVSHIYDTTLEIFERSKLEKLPTNFVANELAEEYLNRGNQ